MPHADRERELQISLATALRELDEARTDAANLRFVNDKARESLAAANARADDAEARLSNSRRSAETFAKDLRETRESLAAARRECAEQARLNAELHRGACSGYAALLSQMDRIGNAIIGAKAGHHDGAEVVTAALNLAAPAPAPGEETKR